MNSFFKNKTIFKVIRFRNIHGLVWNCNIELKKKWLIDFNEGSVIILID